MQAYRRLRAIVGTHGRDAASSLRSGYSPPLAVALDVGASSLATADAVPDANASGMASRTSLFRARAD